VKNHTGLFKVLFWYFPRSEGSLNQHIKIKHPLCYNKAMLDGGLYRLRRQLSKAQSLKEKKLFDSKKKNSK